MRFTPNRSKTGASRSDSLCILHDTLLLVAGESYPSVGEYSLSSTDRAFFFIKWLDTFCTHIFSFIILFVLTFYYFYSPSKQSFDSFKQCLPFCRLFPSFCFIHSLFFFLLFISFYTRVCSANLLRSTEKLHKLLEDQN